MDRESKIIISFGNANYCYIMKFEKWVDSENKILNSELAAEVYQEALRQGFSPQHFIPDDYDMKEFLQKTKESGVEDLTKEISEVEDEYR